MKINKNVKNAVLGTVSASIMASSCAPYFSQEDEDSLYVETNTSFDLGEIAVPMTINLSKEERDYIVFLQKLSKDIVEYPVVAKEFSKNPELFLQRYGYNEPIDLDEGLLKMVVAMGDEDINRAIKSNDIKLFYNLCKQKDLLSIPKKYNFSEYSDILIKQLGEKGININQEEIQSIIFPVVVITLVAAATTLVAITDAAVYNCGWLYTEISGVVKKNNLDLLMEENPSLNIWILKGATNDTYLVANEFIETQIDDMINVIKDKSPSIFDKNSVDDLRNLLKINLYK